MRPSVGELFAGVGGFGLGFEEAGYSLRFQVEVDPYCTQVLRHRWPRVPRWADVREVSGAELPRVDVLTFGSPCQDLSVAGRRAGFDGDRSVLFHEATRIIKEAHDHHGSSWPAVAVWENVPGALTSNGGADFGAVLDAMAGIGALDIQWGILDAQWWGVPQRRRRLFLTAVFDPAVAARCPRPLLPLTEGVPRDPREGRAAWPNTAGSLTSSFGGVGADFAHAQAQLLIPEPQRWDGSDVTPALDVSMLAKQQTMPDKGRFAAVVEPAVFVKGGRAHHADDAETWVADGPAPALNGFDNQSPTRATVLAPVGFNWANGGGYGEANDGLGITVDGTGPLSTSQVPAIAQQHAQVRRITPLEAERLMGFPDDHTRYGVNAAGRVIEIADTNRYKMCGNAVVAPVAAWIATKIHPILTRGDRQ